MSQGIGIDSRKRILSDLTIVIPSYNRHSYLTALVQFWEVLGVRVIAVDGSRYELPDQIKTTFSDSVTYCHLPVGVIERINTAISLVQTPFVTFLADDDIHLPNALIDAMNALRANPEAVSAIGQVAGFRGAESGRTKIVDLYPELATRSVSAPSLNQRLYAHFNPYVPLTIYGVGRSEIVASVMDVISRSDHKVYAQSEIEFEVLVSSLGATVVLERLHWLRSLVTRQEASSDVLLDRTNLFYRWWQDPNRTEWREQWTQMMVDEIGRLTEGNRAEIEVSLTASLDAYAMSVSLSSRNASPPSLIRRGRVSVFGRVAVDHLYNRFLTRSWSVESYFERTGGHNSDRTREDLSDLRLYLQLLQASYDSPS